MNKEEILAKSREDNRGADERFRILNQRQSVVMVGAMLAMWLLLFLWNVFRGWTPVRAAPSCSPAWPLWASGSFTSSE